MNARRIATLAAPFAALVALEARGQQAAAPQARGPEVRTLVEATQGRVCRTTELVGVGVTGTRGEKLGELTDLVIDDEHDCVAFGIVATNDEKLLPIPFVVMKHVAKEGAGSISVATPDLGKAPSFDAKSWPEFDRAYVTKVYDFYKAQPYWKNEVRIRDADESGLLADDPEVRSAPTAHAPTALAGEHATARTGTFRATTAIGQNVQDGRDKKVAELFDVVVDESSGHVAYAILSTGGFLGVGEKFMALPWASLKAPAAEGKPRVLDASREQIEKAPSFEKSKWPDLSDRKVGGEIYRYWNQKPYWEARA